MRFGTIPQQRRYQSMGRSGGSLKMRLIIGLVLAGFALLSYFGSSEFNEITGETQRIALSTDQEIALGLQAAPQMSQQHGGLHPDPKKRALVKRVGEKLVRETAASITPYKFDFHLLADPNTINAFALPGGQIFITAALFDRLETEGQLAGVLGHEIGHVVARHGAEHMAKQQLTQGLTGAAVVAAGDPNVGRMAQMVGQVINMKYGRGDELESDYLGVRFLASSGYDPRALIGVMKILAEANNGAAPPEFFSTHPNPKNRIAKIEEAIANRFPGGVPSNLKK